MVNKISIIKQILETDEETDRKILSILQVAKEEAEEKRIHIEERMSKRKDILLDADLNNGKENIYAETENISSTGAFIRTEKKIAIGEDIAIKFISSDGAGLGFVAQVVRVSSHGIGVVIKAISEKNRIKLTKFIDQF